MDLDPQERHVAFAAVRRYVDSTGYGGYINDGIAQALADAVVIAVEQQRAAVADHQAQQAKDTAKPKAKVTSGDD